MDSEKTKSTTAVKPVVSNIYDFIKNIDPALFREGNENEDTVLRRRVLWTVIALHADADGTNSTPSMPTLARRIGYSLRTVVRDIDWLCNHGLLVKKVREGYASEKGKTNRYEFPISDPRWVRRPDGTISTTLEAPPTKQEWNEMLFWNKGWAARQTLDLPDPLDPYILGAALGGENERVGGELVTPMAGTNRLKSRLVSETGGLVTPMAGTQPSNDLPEASCQSGDGSGFPALEKSQESANRSASRLSEGSAGQPANQPEEPTSQSISQKSEVSLTPLVPNEGPTTYEIDASWRRPNGRLPCVLQRAQRLAERSAQRQPEIEAVFQKALEEESPQPAEPTQEQPFDSIGRFQPEMEEAVAWERRHPE